MHVTICHFYSAPIACVDPRLVFGLGVTGTPLNLTVRWPGPTWRTQVIDDDAALEAAIGSMERPLVVVEPA